MLTRELLEQAFFNVLNRLKTFKLTAAESNYSRGYADAVIDMNRLAQNLNKLKPNLSEIFNDMVRLRCPAPGSFGEDYDHTNHAYTLGYNKAVFEMEPSVKQLCDLYAQIYPENI
jgi:hypothetical protein